MFFSQYWSILSTTCQHGSQLEINIVKRHDQSTPTVLGSFFHNSPHANPLYREVYLCVSQTTFIVNLLAFETTKVG